MAAAAESRILPLGRDSRVALTGRSRRSLILPAARELRRRLGRPLLNLGLEGQRVLQALAPCEPDERAHDGWWPTRADTRGQGRCVGRLEITSQARLPSPCGADYGGIVVVFVLFQGWLSEAKRLFAMSPPRPARPAQRALLKLLDPTAAAALAAPAALPLISLASRAGPSRRAVQILCRRVASHLLS